MISVMKVKYGLYDTETGEQTIGFFPPHMISNWHQKNFEKFEKNLRVTC